MKPIPLLLAVALAAHTAAASAQATSPNVLVDNGQMQLTYPDFQAELMRVPPEHRNAFSADPKRVQQLLNNMVLYRTLAAQARKDGLDRDPLVQRRLALEADRLLAQLKIQAIEEAAAKAFDAKSKDFEVRAREIYQVDVGKFAIPPRLTASHILLDPAKHGGDEATLALARELRAKIVAGADFTTLARERSDDPSAQSNNGRLENFTAEQMDPAFSKAAMELPKEGDVSEPVKSRFGYHIIRLEGRTPGGTRSFEDAKPSILADMRKRYIDEQRELAVNAIRGDTSIKVNQAAVDALVTPIRPPGGAPATAPVAK